MIDLLFKPAKNRGQQQFIDRIVERAKSLVADGYRIERFVTGGVAGGNGSFMIFKPGNNETRKSRRDYFVTRLPKWDCDCDCFCDVGDCKHRIAVALMLRAEQEEAEALQLELGWQQHEAEQVARFEAEERHLAGIMRRAGIDY